MKLNDFEMRIAWQLRRLRYSTNRSKTIQLCAFHIALDCSWKNKKYSEHQISIYLKRISVIDREILIVSS
jgi:hypothetical protein